MEKATYGPGEKKLIIIGEWLLGATNTQPALMWQFVACWHWHPRPKLLIIREWPLLRADGTRSLSSSKYGQKLFSVWPWVESKTWEAMTQQQLATGPSFLNLLCCFWRTCWPNFFILNQISTNLWQKHAEVGHSLPQDPPFEVPLCGFRRTC